MPCAFAYRLRACFVLIMLVAHVLASDVGAQVHRPPVLLDESFGMIPSPTWRSTTDQMGFLWIATEDGLLRYDGYTYSTWSKTGPSGNSLDDNFVFQVIADHAGMIWFSTKKKLYRMNPLTFQVQPFEIIPAGTKPRSSLEPSIMYLFEDRAYNLWIGTSFGVCQLNEGRKAIRLYDFKELPGHKGYINYIQSISQDAQGAIWCNSGAGLWQINPENATSLLHSIPGQLYHDRALLCKDGVVYTGGEILTRFNPETGAQETLLTADETRGVLTSILQDPFDSDILWCASKGGGLIRLDLRTRVHTFPKFPEVAEFQRPVMINDVYAVSNTWWISSDEGLWRFEPQAATVQPWDTNDSSIPQGNIHQVFSQQLPVPKTWITTDRGLKERDDSTQQWKVVNLPVSPAIDPRSIIDVHASREGLWLTDWSNGVYLFRNTTLKQVLWNSDLQSGDPDYRIRFDGVRTNRKGETWICAAHALIRYQNGDLTWYPAPPLLNPEGDTLMQRPNMRHMTEDAQGNWWMSSGFQILNHVACLIRFTPSSGTFTYFYPGSAAGSFPATEDVHGMTSDGRGRIWCATTHGVVQFTPSDTPGFYLRDLREINGKTQAEAITASAQHVWVGTRNGLIAISEDSRTLLITEADGLPESRMESTLVCDPSNELIFVHDGILYRISADQFLTPTAFRAIRLTECSFGNTSNSLFQSEIDTIALHWQENNLTLAYSALSLGSTIPVHYSHRLLGWEKEWIDDGTDRRVHYSNLKGGNYRFQVRVVQPDGKWSGPLLDIPVCVAVPWYRTGWFISLVALCVILTIYGLYRWRFRRLKEVQDVRNKIAKDLHDEVGSSLSSIAIYGELVNNLVESDPDRARMMTTKLQDIATESVDRMRDIVWSLSPRNDSFLNMIQHMKRSAQDQLDTRNIQLDFQSDSEVESIQLPVETRKEILLIFKEAINNARKHSNASKVTVQFSLADGHLELVIHDDGIGFNGGRPDGNGLENMKRRASDIHAAFSIQSTPGKGTRIRLLVPLSGRSI